MKPPELIQLMRAYLVQKQWGKAIALGQHVLNETPNWAAVYPLLGKALARQGQLAKAISAYQRGLQLQPNHAEAHADLGELYVRQRQFAKVVAHYHQALTLKPGWTVVHYNLAVVMHQLGNWEAAIDHYQQVIALQPAHWQAHFNLGVVYDQQGQLALAIEQYRQVIQHHPQNSKVYSNLGSSLSKQNKYEEAIAVYQQGLVLHPENAALYNNWGQASLALGNLGAATTAYYRAIALQPNLGIAHFNLGCLWLQHHNYSQAVACFQTVVELEPNHIDALSHCGNALMVSGKWKQALDYFRKAIDLQPEFVTVFCQRAQGLEGADLLERARICCAQFLTALLKQLDVTQIQDYLWQTYWYIGEVLYEYGAVQQAEGAYHKAIHLNPYQVTSYLRLGRCLAQQQRRDAAVAVYRMGLALSPQHPQLNFELGTVLEQQRYYLPAIQAYKQVLQSPDQEQIKVPDHTPTVPAPLGIFPMTTDWVQRTSWPEVRYVALKGSPRLGSPCPPVPPSKEIMQSDCGGVTCKRCMTRLIKAFDSVPLGRKVFRCAESPALAITPPSTFVITLPEGRAWIAPQLNDWMICKQIAIITPDNYILGDLSRFYPWMLPGCQQHDLSGHPLLHPVNLPPLEELEGTVVILSALSGHVYYHWMIDVLPRLGLLWQSGLKLEQVDWFVVNSMTKPFQQETLNRLGVPMEKVVRSDRHPHIQAQRLIVPSFPGHLDWIPPDTISFLRRTFLADAAPPPTQRIYISRAHAKYRQVINEDAVMAQLALLGFINVHLERLTVAAQAALFASAQVIIAAHGSSLTNLVFCQAGTQVLEIFAPNYVRTDYWMVSQHLHLQHYYLMGQTFDCDPIRQLMHQNTLTEDILVDLNALHLALQAMGLEQN